MNAQDYQDLYEHMNCQPRMLGWGGDPQAEGKRRKVDKITQYATKHIYQADNPDKLIDLVRQEWTAGLGPIASALMWWAIRALAKQVVLWIWKRMNQTPGRVSV